MDINKMKRTLLQYPTMTERLNNIGQEIENIKARKEALYGVKAVNIDNMPHSNTISDSTYQKVEKIVDSFDKDIDSLLDEFERIQREQSQLSRALRKLTPDEHKVIEARYLLGIKWDYVPAKINMSRRTCFRLHDNAIMKMIDIF